MQEVRTNITLTISTVKLNVVLNANAVYENSTWQCHTLGFRLKEILM